MTRILIHAENADELASLLSKRFPDIRTCTCTSNTELVSGLQDFAPDAVYSVRFDSSTPFPTAPLLAEGGPRWITVGGSGCDHLGQWDTSRVTVTNAAGVGAAMMAEFVFGCALHFTLDIDGLARDKSDRIWRDRFVTPLRGKTLLIVGLGQTGQAVARRAQAFDMHVIATRARPAPAENVDEVFADARIGGCRCVCGDEINGRSDRCLKRRGHRTRGRYPGLDGRANCRRGLGRLSRRTFAKGQPLLGAAEYNHLAACLSGLSGLGNGVV